MSRSDFPPPRQPWHPPGPPPQTEFAETTEHGAVREPPNRMVETMSHGARTEIEDDVSPR